MDGLFNIRGTVTAVGNPKEFFNSGRRSKIQSIWLRSPTNQILTLSAFQTDAGNYDESWLEILVKIEACEIGKQISLSASDVKCYRGRRLDSPLRNYYTYINSMSYIDTEEMQKIDALTTVRGSVDHCMQTALCTACWKDVGSRKRCCSRTSVKSWVIFTEGSTRGVYWNVLSGKNGDVVPSIGSEIDIKVTDVKKFRMRVTEPEATLKASMAIFSARGRADLRRDPTHLDVDEPESTSTQSSEVNVEQRSTSILERARSLL